MADRERTYEMPGVDDTLALGEAVAGLLRAGDVLVLTGELGAGKTTFTRGLGAGLGVRGAVTSPTFVLSRVHPPLGEGPGLVHVDAYRLGLGEETGLAELDGLDLDASLEESVTVVEWGEGLAEVLATDRLEVLVERPPGGAIGAGDDGAGDDGAGDDEEETRRITLRGVGPRWADVAWPQ